MKKKNEKKLKDFVKDLPTSVEYLSFLKEASKKDKRKAYRVCKTIGLATCETIAILKEKSALKTKLKKEFRAWFTEERFFHFIEVTFPELLDGGHDALENYIKEGVEKVYGIVEESSE